MLRPGGGLFDAPVKESGALGGVLWTGIGNGATRSAPDVGCASVFFGVQRSRTVSSSLAKATFRVPLALATSRARLDRQLSKFVSSGCHMPLASRMVLSRPPKI